MVELWQRLGYTDFGEWRRATEKNRREAKRAAAPSTLATARWRPTQPLALPLPAAPAAALQPPSSDAKNRAAPAAEVGEAYGMLPGLLREDVCVTPRGRRRHSFSHTSPGGTKRCAEYVSPPGVQRHACEQRLPCLHRLTAARRAYTLNRVFSCGSCKACQTYASSMEQRALCWFPLGMKTPIEKPSAVKRSRLSFGACERKIETKCAACGAATECEQYVGDFEWYCAACVADWESEGEGEGEEHGEDECE
jgi:hypothetical protein